MAENTESTSFDYVSLSSQSPTERLGYLFNQVYYHFIIERVKFVEFQIEVPCMRDHCGPILSIDRKDGSKAAAIAFLDRLKDVNEPGKYQQLLEALKQYGYKTVVDAIEHGEVEHHHDEHKKLLEIFYSKLRQKVDATEMASQLSEKEVISSDQERRIRYMAKIDPAEALFQLIDDMPRKNPKWFEIFWEALYSSDQLELCKLLDEKLYGKKQASSDHTNDDIIIDISSLEIENLGDSPFAAVDAMNTFASPRLQDGIPSSEKTRPRHLIPSESVQVSKEGNPSEVAEVSPGCQCFSKVVQIQNQLTDIQSKIDANSVKLDAIISLLKN